MQHNSANAEIETAHPCHHITVDGIGFAGRGAGTERDLNHPVKGDEYREKADRFGRV